MNGRLWIGVLLVITTLAGCGREAGGGTSGSAADLRLTGQRELRLDDERIPHPAALSPSGKWLAALDEQGRLCVYAVDSLLAEHCVRPENRLLDPLSLSWSPDSQRLAFTDNPSQDFSSDLWLLQVESGGLSNLTQDESLIRSPAWSPDGQSLTFFRALQGELALYRLPANGGTLEKLLDGQQFTGNYLWSGDGKKILFTAFGPSPEPGGLWIADANGQNPRQLVGADPEMGLPSLMDVSPKGDRALIIYRMAGSQDFFSEPNLSYCALVDLESSAVTPLKEAQGDQVEFYGPTDAIFNPDGSRVLYSYKDAGGQSVLATRDVAGGPETILLTNEVSELFYGHGLSLVWAENDTLYLPHAGLLLTLATN